MTCQGVRPFFFRGLSAALDEAGTLEGHFHSFFPFLLLHVVLFFFFTRNGAPGSRLLLIFFFFSFRPRCPLLGQAMASRRVAFFFPSILSIRLFIATRRLADPLQNAASLTS